MPVDKIRRRPSTYVQPTTAQGEWAWLEVVGDELQFNSSSGTTVKILDSKAEIVTATNAISALENGKTFFLNSGTEFVSTLPAPALGLRFNFICTAAPSGADYTIFTSGGANIMLGQVYTLDVNSATDPDLETSGGDTISFVSAKAVAGDRVEVFSDGTNWFAYCFCSVFDAITITTAA